MTGPIGLGNKGRAIAERLVDVGEKLVVWNRNPNKADRLDRARVVGSPAEIAVSATVVLSVLANYAAIEKV